MKKCNVRDLSPAGRRVLVRVDFNVPLTDGRVADDTRVRQALDTLKWLSSQSAKTILASHLGRPKGVKNENLSLKPLAVCLSELMGKEVAFVTDCVGEEVKQAVAGLQPGDILLLENLRFYRQETENDPDFSRELAGCADAYVNDAFGTAHRAHASTVGVPQVLGRGFAGLLMERELEALGQVLEKPEKPVVGIFGGAKVSDKLDVIKHFLAFSDAILLGGGMAYTFLKARGEKIGRSLLETEKVATAGKVLVTAEERGVRFRLPEDHVVASEATTEAPTRIVEGNGFGPQERGLDIGPRTIRAFESEIKTAKTLIWNGPMGVFELAPFSKGTQAIAKAVASSSGFSLVGGGDSVAAIHKAGVANRIGHISTGGGASLEFLAGNPLPGVEVLTDRESGHE